MDRLTQIISQLLADNVALGFKAHGYHWNIESDDFHQFHEFFGDIYSDFNGVTDTYAEWIRMLKSYAPYRLTDFFDLSTISEPVIVGDPDAMLVDLYNYIERHIEDLKEAINVATQANEHGLVDFLAGRQAASQKWCWQIRASIEVEGAG